MPVFHSRYFILIGFFLFCHVPEAGAAQQHGALISYSADLQLFGHRGIVSEDTSAFTKWNGVLERQAHSKPTEKINKWHIFLDSIRSKNPDEQIKAVNNYMNRVPYISDKDNYGVGDYWATLAEFLERGGDCEDYALAKYFSLLELGFDAKQMKIVILYDRSKGLDHTVLALTWDGKTEILDNQSRYVRDADALQHYKPIYAISGYSWWRFL